MTPRDRLTPTPRRHCAATSKQTGKPCGSTPPVGWTVCKWHGGRAPQVVRSARERLDALVDPAIVQLTKLIDSADTDSVKLAAIRDVLDRAGYKPTDKLQVGGDAAQPLEIVIQRAP
ncbi:MAG: hypothetical protein NUW22_13745 [Acidobacteria bacterium]|nr:hypothetical protein [Acidobacteriota bacterium]